MTIKTEKQIAQRLKGLTEKFKEAKLEATKLTIRLMIDELLWVLNRK